jgi:hypothetical protein
MILGIGTDNTLLMRKNLQAPWQKLASRPPALAAATVLRNGVILGVGKDTTLWKQELSGTYKQIPNSQTVKGAAVMRDGTLLGVGMDNQLWMRAMLTSPWSQVPGSGLVLSVAVLPNGTIVGVGTDHQLWTRAALNGRWSLVPGSGAVKSIAALPDGTLVGVGMDNALLSRAALTSPWAQVPHGAPIVSVAAWPVPCDTEATVTPRPPVSPPAPVTPPAPSPQPPKLPKLVVKQYFNYTDVYEVPIAPNSQHVFREHRPWEPFTAMSFYIENHGEGDLQLLGATVNDTSCFVLTEMTGTPTGQRPTFPKVIRPRGRAVLFLVYSPRAPGPRTTQVQLRTGTPTQPATFQFTIQVP